MNQTTQNLEDYITELKNELDQCEYKLRKSQKYTEKYIQGQIYQLKKIIEKLESI